MKSLFDTNLSPLEIIQKQDVWCEKLINENLISLSALKDNFFIKNKFNWESIYERCTKLDLTAQDIVVPWQLIAFSGEEKLIDTYFTSLPHLLEKKDPSGRNALNFAAWSGNIDAVKALWREEKPSGVCGSPLHYAALSGAHDVMQYLVDKGADPKACHPSTGATLTHLAVESGSIKALKKALEFGVDPAQLDHNGKNALDIAKDAHKKDLEKHLIKNCPQLNPKKPTGCVIL